MMNRIDEYLNSLDKKNLIMLYLSVVIAAFVIYYNFNYKLYNEIKNNENKIASLNKKLRSNNLLKIKIKKIKKEYKEYERIIYSLKDDLRYLKILIATSNVLNVDDKKFIKILNSILESSIVHKMNPSYEIDKNESEFRVYTLNLNGKFNRTEYSEFVNFVRDIQKIKNIKEFKEVSLKDNNQSIEYMLKINFWGIK